MAKSDSFFIRASVDLNGTTYTQQSIDLGSYVDALGKSVLRVHNIAVQYGSNGVDAPSVPTGQHRTGFALMTQSNTDLPGADDRSVIASGSLFANENPTGGVHLSESLDVSPQHWTNGYLVAVEQIYLASKETASLGLTEVNIVMECTVETLSQSAAMALALSQQ